MAKIRRKGESGAATNFISRNMAIKKLQVTLADFRRLCILKGIYPREPRNKKKANKGSTAPTTFYYTKDISYLLHEPVLNKFRDHKVFARKLSKALGKQEYNTAKRLEENRPSYTLDHIIKERFPTFTEALRDLDDALSMLFLFSSMPTTDKVGTAIIQNCDRLCREFEHYVIRSKSLRKVFLSIKGIYYQAEIKGQDVTWLVPYKFSQQVPTDVDFRIMLTFLEFHQTFVGFVNYRLYTELGLVYPPKINIDLENDAGGLGALDIQRAGLEGESTKKSIKPKKTKKLLASLDMAKIAAEGDDAGVFSHDEADDTEMMNDEGTTEQELDDFSAVGPAPKEGEEVALPQQTTSAPTTMFSNFTFYLSREVPRYSLEFILKSFGAKVAWDPILGGGSPLPESDPSITHHVCDRPNQEKRFLNRSYLQPQWVYDCINKGQLQSIDAYLPGAMLPPHLSPFVKLGDGSYNPEEVMADVEADADVESVSANEADESVIAAHTDDVANAAEDAALELEPEVDDDELDDPEARDAAIAQRELEAEASGIPFSQFTAPSQGRRSSTARSGTQAAPSPAAPATGPLLTAAQKTEKEGKELARMMMSNKQKKLYAKMKYSNAKKEDEVNSLRRKRKELAKTATAKKSGNGKGMGKEAGEQAAASVKQSKKQRKE